MIVTRFAPSPTGELHLGHAYSALFAYDAAMKQNGKFLLRLEDIDPIRCKEAFVPGMIEEMEWLGLHWEEPVRRQSEHLDDYEKALDFLRGRGLLYPCYCTRREVMAEAAASGAAPHEGEEGPLYSGTCRRLTEQQRSEMEITRVPVWRLNMQKALAQVHNLTWRDKEMGVVQAHPESFGDIVLARRDVATSYHLSVTIDDALQGVTLVTRGRDLARATDIHRLLQALLDLTVPSYHHHHLLVDAQGKRYAKRDKSVTIRALRESGKTPDQVRAMAFGASAA